MSGEELTSYGYRTKVTIGMARIEGLWVDHGRKSLGPRLSELAA